MRKLINQVCAVVVANAILISGLNINYVSCIANVNQKELVQNEINVTANQKKEAKEQDDKISNQLKATKASKEKSKNPQVVKELKEFNTANSTTYLLSNGDRRLEIYGEDIRYKENGKYVEYNPELKKITDGENEEIKKEGSYAPFGHRRRVRSVRDHRPQSAAAGLQRGLLLRWRKSTGADRR